ncbi:Mrx12p NDAI_0I02060 [Naumovozyma dairenensis CBS 421]|uniref:Uncharacterized protein n=1 Tax=Naumovozyma dairenensis (strain ATCC 10597 / BCRC 20456 / CBS 421 / NBRC 0211 / NRRL Y-12639) TaxID=1071378 RepID=G0WG64_NAUDC|nr:hypothetical protein NDAI_0I02060 [Naumovozyma dairenensis CBS 421]CCD26775.1 hypothetical protein NDAI_0I02060 [Naumovozyma dairenensis CBS 421]
METGFKRSSPSVEIIIKFACVRNKRKIHSMLLFKRAFSVSRRAFSANKKDFTIVSKQILNDPCFDIIRKDLTLSLPSIPKDPYTLSSDLNNLLKASKKLPPSHHSAIHNKLIEELAKYEFGIATIHSKFLETLGKPLTTEAFIEIIKNNPGRVNSSWELFTKYLDQFTELQDDILLCVLEKMVHFDAVDLADGKLDMTVEDICKSLILVEMISKKRLIPENIAITLVKNMLKQKVSFQLPSIIGLCKTPIFDLIEDLTELTSRQVYDVYKALPFDVVATNKEFLQKAVAIIGENLQIVLTEEEKENATSFKKIMEGLRLEYPKLNGSNPDYEILTAPIDTKTDFIDTLNELARTNLDTTDIHLAKNILRSIGVFRGDMTSFFQFYRLYISKFPDHSSDLTFETFLALSYQSYKTSNTTLAEYAEAFIGNCTEPDLHAKMLIVLILTKSKFNIDDSLDIYNKNIQSLSKEKNEAANLSSSDLVTESLILAYLSKQDVDFARVIFDGAVGEKVVEGLTAVRRIKNILSEYGEAVTKEDFESVMEDKILKVMQDI